MPSGRTDEDRPPPGSLFVLWSAARHEEQRIVADLDEHFTIVAMFDVHWTPGRVRRNYERFYPDLDVRGVYHVHNKGSGDLLAVVVTDPRPVFEHRMTSRGRRFVNSRYIDAKERYRSWTREFAVHSAETDQEIRRDLMMLIGVDVDELQTADDRVPSARRVAIHRDPTGAGGWASERELFDMVNRSADYVVLDAPHFDHHQQSQAQGRIRLLTDDCAQLVRILDAKPAVRGLSDRGGAFTVRIDDRSRRVEIRETGDGYIDPEWARNCLERREFDRKQGIYRPTREDAIAFMAYDSLVHHRQAPRSEIRRIASLIDPLERERHGGSEATAVRAHLERFLHANGYTYATPQDPAVFMRYPATAASWPRLHQSMHTLRRAVRIGIGWSMGLASSWYLTVRDWFVLHLQWVRRLRSRII